MSTFRDQLRSRYAALGIVVLIALGALLVRLWTMQVLQGDAFALQAESNRLRKVYVDAPRGRILDRNGRPLVINRATLAVSIDPMTPGIRELVADLRAGKRPSAAAVHEQLGELSEMLGVPEMDMLERIASVKEAALEPRIVAIDVPLDVASQVAENQARFDGVSVEEITVRTYPEGDLAAHVLGYTGEIPESELEEVAEDSDYASGDIVGRTGAERQFENVLRGVKGVTLIEVDAAGRPQQVVSDQAPVAGKDIRLTIDIDVQRVAEDALDAAIAEAHRQGYNQSRAGAAVVLDVRTGEVIAMASRPTYDPEEFIGGISTEAWEQLTAETSEYPLNNRAIMSAYPPASTFKVVTGLAGLEAGITSANAGYRCPGKWTEMGEQWPKWCWKRTGHGYIDFTTGVQQSCDVVFYEIGYEFYRRKQEELQSYSRALGLGSETGIDLPGEVDGRVPDAAWKKEYNRNYPEYQMWLPGDSVNMAIGQGDLLTTPLQLACVYAGVANDGTVMKPHVLLDVLDQDGNPLTPYEPTVLAESEISTSSIDVMENALVRVTRYGTGASAFRGFRATIAGKTGTAQVYRKDDYAWFAGYGPVGDPQYAVVVVIEQGGHGGSVAGPAVRNIFAQLLGLPLENVRATDISR